MDYPTCLLPYLMYCQSNIREAEAQYLINVSQGSFPFKGIVDASWKHLKKLTSSGRNDIEVEVFWVGDITTHSIMFNECEPQKSDLQRTHPLFFKA